jgi:hypothetical protein
MRSSCLLPFCLLVACGARVAPEETFDTGVLDAADASDALDTSSPPPDTPDFTRCAEPGSCVVVPRSCCGSCGAAITEDMIGVETSQSSSYRSSVCKDMACDACYRQQDPFLQAFCQSSRCVAVDLHSDPMTACTTDTDCRLHYAACCEPCDARPESILALATSQLSTYLAKVCAPDSSCPPCIGGYPPAAKAVCDTTKHCSVTGIGSP